VFTRSNRKDLNQLNRNIAIKGDNTFGKLDDDEFFVEEILDHRYEKGNTYYLIKWQDYDSESNTWEKEKNLDCSEKLNEYWKSKTQQRR